MVIVLLPAVKAAVHTMCLNSEPIQKDFKFVQKLRSGGRGSPFLEKTLRQQGGMRQQVRISNIGQSL